MTDKPVIKVEGLARLSRQLKALDQGLDKETTVINRAAAELVAETARTKVPRRTGRLGASIRAGATKRTASVRAGGARVPYAPPIHWGWPSHNIAPQPFLYEALDARKAEVIYLYEKRIKALVEHAFPNGRD